MTLANEIVVLEYLQPSQDLQPQHVSCHVAVHMHKLMMNIIGNFSDFSICIDYKLNYN